LTTTAHAADLDVNSLKDPLPDGPLKWHGITVYGTVDVGGAYQTHGAPVGSEQSWLISQPSGRAQSLITENGLSSSALGIKVEEHVGYGFTAVGRLETSFDPLSTELADRGSGQTLFSRKLAPLTYSVAGFWDKLAFESRF
jgi:hypothetical protein